MKKIYFVALGIIFFNLSLAQVKVNGTNYATLRAAFTAINAGTHTGGISIQITGDTSESADAELKGSGIGNASYSSIIISPSGGATRTILFTGGSLILYGAKNVLIDGSNFGGNALRFVSAGVGGDTIYITAGAANNTIQNCSVLGAGNGIIRLVGSSPAVDYITISHCNIGPYNSNLPTTGISISPGNYAITNTTIDDNNIYDYSSPSFISTGIDITGITTNFTISNNRFYQTASRNSSQNCAISIVELKNQGTNYVTGNVIGYASAARTGTYALVNGNFTGILYSSNGSPVTYIRNNTIAGISLSVNAISGNTLVGICILKGKTEVTGNTIGSMSATGSIVVTSSATGENTVRGILKAQSGDIQVKLNNIGGITGTGTGTINIIGIDMQMGDTTIYDTFQGDVNQNTIGGTVANSIRSTTGGTSIVVGIKRWMDLNVLDNTIRNLTGSGASNDFENSGVVGIQSLSTYNYNVETSRNTIFNLTNANTTNAASVTGIRSFGTSSNNPMRRNFIHSLSLLADNAGSQIVGIRQSGICTKLFNNMIALGSGVNKNVRIDGVRVYVSDGYTLSLRDNSIYIGGTQPSGSAGSSAFFADGIAHFQSYHNNILVNNRTNAIGATATHTSIVINQYDANQGYMPWLLANVYYGSGSGYLLASVNGTPKTTRADLKAVVNSSSDLGYAVDPGLINPTATIPNLHINPSLPSIVEGRASAPSGDGYEDLDIDGDIRYNNTPYDIGADAGNFIRIDDPSITAVSDIARCTGTTLTLTGTGFNTVAQVRIGTSPLSIVSVGTDTMVVNVGNTVLSGNIYITNTIGTASSSQVVTIYAPPAVTASPVHKDSCSNAVATFAITATGAASYQWRDGTTNLSNGGIYSNVTTATLTLTSPPFSLSGHSFNCVVTGFGGCTVTSGSADITVTQAQPIVLTASQTTVILGNSATINATGATNYSWSPATGLSATTGSSVIATPSVTTTYTVTSTDCTTPKTIIITVLPVSSTGVNALKFDGVNDGVTLSNTALGNFGTGAFTIEMDIKTTVQYGPLMTKRAVCAHTNFWDFGIFDGRVQLEIDQDGAGTNYKVVVGGTRVNDGNWHHVAVTRDLAGLISIYADGVLDATGSAAGITNINTTAPVLLGMNTCSNMNGSFDEVKIWNRALTQCEIQNNKSVELSAGQTNLAVYYKFNQGVAGNANPNLTTLLDSSGNNNSGTLTNFALSGTTSNWISPGAVTSGATSPAFVLLSVPVSQNFCDAVTVTNLSVSGTGIIKWYNTATGGTALAATASLSTGNYYVSQTTGTCESTRTMVAVTVITAPASGPQVFCVQATVANLSATGINIKWFLASSGGVPLAGNTALTTRTYYVSQTYICESARTPVAVTIASPTNNGNITQTQCGGTYTWPANGITYSASKFAVYTSGCNTAVLQLTINPMQTYYADADSDTYGNAAVSITACSAPSGYVLNNSDCNDADFNINCSGSIVNLKLFIEGYYIGASTMNAVKANQDYISATDEVEDLTIELHHPTTYALVDTTIATLHTNGTLQAKFNTAAAGSYYIAVKGVNLVQTWSAEPKSIGATPLNYDFSSSASQAYGDNIRAMEPGVFACYSGDINQDESLDNSDFDQLFPDVEGSAFGVLATDLNGDGAVDNSDFDDIFNNVDNSIYSSHPF